MSRHPLARPLRRLILTAAVLAVAVGAPARAQPQEDEAPAAQEPALVISAALTAEAWANVGGARTGATTLNNIDVVADLDVEQLAGLFGATARVSLLHNNRGALSSDLVGDLPTVSNIDPPIGALRLHEA